MDEDYYLGFSFEQQTIQQQQEKAWNKDKVLEADTVIKDLISFMDEIGIDHIAVRNAKKYLMNR